MTRRVVVAAGGTGGHFFPGLSLAQELRARGWEALFLVRAADPALASLETKGFAGVEIALRGLPRGLSLELLTFAPKLLGALRLVGRVLDDFRPDAVVGMGGYLTFPLAAAAARRRLPRLVHEANAALGLANRGARALGARVLWGLPPMSGGAAQEVVGTPIRAELCGRADRAQARRSLGLDPEVRTLLVFGGSQGARGVNRAVPAALKAAARAGARAQVLHLSGPADEAQARAGYEEAGVAAKVLPFLSDMRLAYGAADLVICRSGASTLAELRAQRAPAVLVPFPSATGNHQEHNARIFERAGACALIREADLSAKLPGALEDLVFSTEAARRLQAMASAYDRAGIPEPGAAARRLADAVEQACAPS